MKFIGIIPARYQSSRFPGKPLCDILGKPMIWHVYSSVTQWDKWKGIYIATDSEIIANECNKLGINFIMTKSSHVDCLDRSAEVVKILESGGGGADRYITIQGDEPLFNVKTLDVDLSPTIVNFYTEVRDAQEMYDCNAVKVVVSKNGKALYFSRYTIPYHGEKTMRVKSEPCIFKQIGVYSFSSEMMQLYTSLRPSNLEVMEGIGLNRLLENDIDINMRHTEHDSISIDTPEDRVRIINILKKKYHDAGCSIADDGTVINCNGYNTP